MSDEQMKAIMAAVLVASGLSDKKVKATIARILAALQ